MAKKHKYYMRPKQNYAKAKSTSGDSSKTTSLPHVAAIYVIFTSLIGSCRLNFPNNSTIVLIINLSSIVLEIIIVAINLSNGSALLLGTRYQIHQGGLGARNKTFSFWLVFLDFLDCPCSILFLTCLFWFLDCRFPES